MTNLNKAVSQYDLYDIHRTLSKTEAEYTFSVNVYRTIIKSSHILDHKANFKKIKD